MPAGILRRELLASSPNYLHPGTMNSASPHPQRAFITPLFKKGDKSKAANYQPVSQNIVYSHLTKFLESNKILSDYQHNFWKRGSCEPQLITTIHDLADGLDRRQQLIQFCWTSVRLLIVFVWQLSSVTMASEIISIFHGCMVWKEKSVTRATDRHQKACRVMPNSDPE